MRRLGVVIGLLALGLVPAALLQSCVSNDCEDNGTCDPYVPAGGTGGASGAGGQAGSAGNAEGGAGTAGEGGSGGGGADAEAGADSEVGADADAAQEEPFCDTTKLPSEEPCVVADAYAIFVSPTGDDTKAGTRAEPMKSLTKAAAAAKSAGKGRVIVCAGQYDENVVLTDGVSLYGGFACGTWDYEAGTKPVFKPSSGYALEGDGVTGELQDLAFEASNAAVAGGSSIAAFVRNTSSLKLTRVRLKAGKGMKGADGVVAPYTYPLATELNGNAGTVGTGGAEKSCACPGGQSTSGGIGGAPASAGQAGGKGLPDWGGGQGGTVTANGCADGSGRNGNTAPPTVAAAGASVHGALSSAGWQPEVGKDAGPGAPGQGGGGGASASTSGGGGGGGCGSCGGAGGPGGKGGGASIALMAFDAPVSLIECEVIASDAGDGGNGAGGQPAMASAGFGGMQGAVDACPGGKGGLGSAGGAGGGGAGGISIGILYNNGQAPTWPNITPAVGAAGKAGNGGSGSNNGVAGQAAAGLAI